jgi:hypothetical protein
VFGFHARSWFIRRGGRPVYSLGSDPLFLQQVIGTEVFDALGGFRELEIFEDLDFSRRMKQAGRVVTLRPPVVSSARRFSSRGPVRTTLADFWLTCRYALGKRFIAPGLQTLIPADGTAREASPVAR